MTPDMRAQTAGLLGFIGAIVSMIGWVLALGDPASGTGLWYAANSVGEVAMIGFAALLIGMILVRDAGRNVVARIFLTLWLLGTVILVVAGVVGLVSANQNSLLFPVGGILATLAGVVASVFIAFNKTVPGLRRWAPLIYSLGGLVAGAFEGSGHSLRVNLADLANNLLTLLLAGAFYFGIRALTRTESIAAPTPVV
jgi:hypothetical protein